MYYPGQSPTTDDHARFAVMANNYKKMQEFTIICGLLHKLFIILFSLFLRSFFINILNNNSGKKRKCKNIGYNHKLIEHIGKLPYKVIGKT